MDKRATEGLRKSIQRKFRKEETKLDGQLLQNWQKHVIAALSLAPGNFALLNDEELHNTLTFLALEVPEFPEKTKVVATLVATLLSERKLDEMLEALSPWQIATFNVQKPCVSGVSWESSKRLAIWRRVLFADAICKFIEDGERGLTPLQHLCKLCLAKTESIDIVYLDNSSALGLEEGKTVWRALLALLSSSLDESVQACRMGWGGLWGSSLEMQSYPGSPHHFLLTWSATWCLGPSNYT